MKSLLFISLFIGALVANTASQCPDSRVVHPRTAEPLQCQFQPDCLSATCHINTSSATSFNSTPPSLGLQLEGSVSFQLEPCSPIQLTLNGSLSGSELGRFESVEVLRPGLGRVQLHRSQGQLGAGQLLMGYLEVLSLSLGVQEALNIALQVHSSEEDYPLFNATLFFDTTKHCLTDPAIPPSTPSTSTTNNTSTTTVPASEAPSEEQASPTTAPDPTPTPKPILTTGDDTPVSQTGDTCEVLLQAASASSALCTARRDSCQVMECELYEFGVTLTFLPCETAPVVRIEVYHTREQVRLVSNRFTASQYQEVRLQETRLLSLNITIQQSSSDRFTFLLEAVFPWGQSVVMVPASQVPFGKPQCVNTNNHTPASPKQPQIPSSTPLSQTELILVVVMAGLLCVFIVGTGAVISAAACFKKHRRQHNHLEKTDIVATTSVFNAEDCEYLL